MRTEVVQDIAEDYLGLNPDTTVVTPLEGGFTGVEKFIIKNNIDGSPDAVFVKIANLTTRAGEAVVLDTEAFMYGVISKIDNVNKYFPRYRGYKRDDRTAALFIDYLPELTWGGPWTSETISFLVSALDEVHSAAIDPITAQEITKQATTLRASLYKQSPYTFDRQKRKQLFEAASDFTTGTFTNSRGQNYHQLSVELLQDISGTASVFNPTAEKKFIIVDLNFGNIGFSDSQAYFVDPVYVELGVAGTDMVNVGINILRTLPKTEENAQLIDIVKTKFLSDKVAFAYAITYWVACTSLGYRGKEDAWMDFQQSCAVTALEVWEQINS